MKTSKRRVRGGQWAVLGLMGMTMASGSQSWGQTPVSPAPIAPQAPAQVGILYIGDSHTAGRFGSRLDQELRKLAGGSELSYGSCGSSPSSWYNGWITKCGWVERKLDGKVRSLKSGPTPKIEELIQENRPRMIVIALGANLMGAGLETIRTTTARMVNSVKASGAKCLWVGPPNGRNKTEPKFSQLYAAIEEAVRGTCELVDSRLLTYYPETGGDGIHFDGLPPAIRDEILSKWVGGVMPSAEKVWSSISEPTGN